MEADKFRLQESAPILAANSFVTGADGAEYQRTTIASLPSDVLLLVLQRLHNTLDLCSACLVCNFWRHVEAANQSSLWSRHVQGIPSASAKQAYLRSSQLIEMRERSVGRAAAWMSSTNGAGAHAENLWTGAGGADAASSWWHSILDALAPRRFNLLVIGPCSSGKTALLNTLAGRPLWHAEFPRQGEFNMTRCMLRAAECTFIEPDRRSLEQCCSGDGDPFLPGWVSAGIDGLVFLLDDACRDGCAALLDATLTAPECAGLPLLLLANKQDLASSPRPSVLLNALRLGEVSAREWRLQGCVTQRALVQGGHGHSGHENEQLSGLRAGLGWLVCAMRERTASVWSATSGSNLLPGEGWLLGRLLR